MRSLLLMQWPAWSRRLATAPAFLPDVTGRRLTPLGSPVARFQLRKSQDRGFCSTDGHPLRCRCDKSSALSASWQHRQVSVYLLGDRMASVAAPSGPYDWNCGCGRAIQALPELLSAVSLTPCRQRHYRDRQQELHSMALRGHRPLPAHLSSPTTAKVLALSPSQTYWGQLPCQCGYRHGQPLANSTPCMRRHAQRRSGCAGSPPGAARATQQRSLHRSPPKAACHEGDGIGCRSVSNLTCSGATRPLPGLIRWCARALALMRRSPLDQPSASARPAGAAAAVDPPSLPGFRSRDLAKL